MPPPENPPPAPPAEAPAAAARNRLAWLPLVALVVAFAGLFAAVILSLGHVLDLPVPCGGSRGCNAVAAHPASKVGGVPIAFFGVAAYLVVIALLAWAPTDRRVRTALLAVTGIGTLASGFLLYYSQTEIRATCHWCVASGAIMAVLLVLAILIARTCAPLRPVGGRWFFALGMLTALAVGVQAGLMQRESLRPPVPAERLAGLTAAELVDPAKALGPATAPVTVVMFGDLWCPACRGAHKALVEYQKANPGEVRLVFRHLPLEDLRGHESSGAAAALSEVAAEQGKFWPFVDAVYALPRQLDRDGYLALLRALGIDAEAAETRIAAPNDPAVQRVYRDADLAERLGINATPTFIVLMNGRPPVSANLKTLPRILNSRPLPAR